MENQISDNEAAAINETISLLESTIVEARMALVAKNATGFTDSLERAEGRANTAALRLRRIRRGHRSEQHDRREASL